MIRTSLTLLALLPGTLTAQSLALGMGQIRSGQHHRQDIFGVEVGKDYGPATLLLDASSRHGENDDDNSGLPWLTALAGMSHTVGPVSLGPYAGVYATPIEDYGTWRFLAGPRAEIRAGKRGQLVVQLLWRSTGLVKQTYRPWTSILVFRFGVTLGER